MRIHLSLALLLLAATAEAQEKESPEPELLDGPESFDDSELEDEGDLLLDEFFDDELDALLEGTSGTSGTEGGAKLDALTEWKGFFEIAPRWYPRDRNRDKNDEQLLLEAELELSFRFRDDLSGYFRPRVFLDLLDGDLERFQPYEAYLTFEGESHDLRVGQFIENWGIVDTYNPLDILNRRDLATDILDPDRLGELGVRYRRLYSGAGAFGEPTLSLYAMPVFQETLFPTEDQRFGLDSALPFDEDGGFEPDGEEQILFTARLQSTFQSRPFNADLQLLAAHGPSHTPVLTTTATELVPAYWGQRTLGAGIRAVPNEDVAGHFLAALTFKAEVAYQDPFGFDDSPIETPESFTSYVFGVDRLIDRVFSEKDQLTLTVEYAGEDGSDAASSLLRPFQDDLIVRAFWEANDFARQSLELRGLFDLDVDENIAELVYERQLRAIHEDLRLTVKGQLFDRASAGESFYSLFDDNSALLVALRLEF